MLRPVEGALAGPRRLLAVVALACAPLAAAEPTPNDTILPVHVVDAVTLRPVAKAVITCAGGRETVTDAVGRAELVGNGGMPLDVVVTAAGFAALHASLASPTADAVELRLDPETLRRSEDVSVSARADDEPAAPGARVLDRAELARLAHVLADDPLRSVHSLPGVAAADDFGATFAARGLGFANVAFYVDGVLMSAPFHTVRDVNDGFSLTLLNSSVVQSLAFISEGAPAPYGDRTGAVLSATTREGGRERFAGHASLALTGLQATLEGPLGGGDTTWLVSARKSYVDYVLERMDREGNVLGFHDATVRIAHHPTPTQTLSLGWLHGRSRWSNHAPDLRPQDTQTADAGTDLGTLQWRWLSSPRTDLRASAFFASETGRNRNLDGTDRLSSGRTQWGLRADAGHTFGGHRLETGVVLRRLADDVLLREFVRRPAATYRIVSNQETSGGEVSAYAQDTWTGLDGRLSVTVGGRVDRFEATGETRGLPRGSVRFDAASGVRLMGAVGRYAQFPDFQQLHGRGGNADLRAEDATHATLGLEKRFGAGLTLRFDAYDLHVSGGFARPEAQWRITGTYLEGPDPEEPLRNGLTGLSRGVEVLLRREGDAGPSGWVAYTFGRSRWRDDAGLEFDGDYDQRHTVTVFASWRPAATWSVSTKLRYGTGFPVAGYYEERADGVYLSAERNTYRPGGYSRWDVRGDKAFLFGRVKLTVYGEVVNVLDHVNRRVTGLDQLDVRSGRVALESDTLFPLLPSLGIAVDF